MTDEIRDLITAMSENGQLQQFQDVDLVDVFLVWDCYAQDWIANSPVLLRFETDDALVERDGADVAAVTIAPVDVTVSPSANSCAYPEDACLCWRRIKR